LNNLTLFGTKVTDAVVPTLAKMKSLRTINIGNNIGKTFIILNGISKLKRLSRSLYISQDEGVCPG
jgi:hypothetical protein